MLGIGLLLEQLPPSVGVLRPGVARSRGGVVRHAHAPQGTATAGAPRRCSADPRGMANGPPPLSPVDDDTDPGHRPHRRPGRLPTDLDAPRAALRPRRHGVLERRRRRSPLLGEDLGVSAGLAAWMISLYVLMLAVTTALYGRISDLVGVRAPLLAGLVLMSVGALVAALAPTFEVLLGARMLQGAGAAAVPTLGVAILSAQLHRRGPRPRLRPARRRRGRRQLPRPADRRRRRGVVRAGAPSWRCRSSARWSCRSSGARCPPMAAAPGSTSSVRSLVALTASGMVLLVQSPSAGLLVAAIGAACSCSVCRRCARRVRRRPDGFLPVEVIRNADRRPQRRRRVGGPGVVVRHADRAARRAPGRGLGGLAGRPGHGAERRGRARSCRRSPGRC